jgi:hypothetical protein
MRALHILWADEDIGVEDRAMGASASRALDSPSN